MRRDKLGNFKHSWPPMNRRLRRALLQFLNAQQEPTAEPVPEGCNFVGQSTQDVPTAGWPIDPAFACFDFPIHRYLPAPRFGCTLALSTGVAKVEASWKLPGVADRREVERRQMNGGASPSAVARSGSTTVKALDILATLADWTPRQVLPTLATLRRTSKGDCPLSPGPRQHE
jgi:hypothetical protein